MTSKLSIVAMLLALSACSAQGDGLPGDPDDTQPFAGIAEGAVVNFTGTEPFWGGSVDGKMLTWSTPDEIAGQRIAVERFAGRGGLSFSGIIDGRSFDLVITPGECSDGMSERDYPFVATANLGGDVRAGCAWIEGDAQGEL